MNHLERKVLENIGEDPESPDVFTDDDVGLLSIRDSINDAIEEIIMITGGVHAKYYIQLVSQTFYKVNLLDGYFGWPYSVRLVSEDRLLEQTDLKKLEKINPRWMETTATPHSYFMVGMDVLGFYPKPSSGLIEMDCVIIPQRISNQYDKISVSNRYEWAVVHYAVSEYWASRGDAKEAISHLHKYLEVMDMVDLMADRSRMLQ